MGKNTEDISNDPVILCKFRNYSSRKMFI